MSQENCIPAIDRAIAILELLGGYGDGLTLAAIARECALSRSSTYRILNSLVAAKYVRRTLEPARYSLASGLLPLAASVRKSMHEPDLLDMSHAHLERLSGITGEASKLSVLDGQTVLCIDAVAGTSDYSLSPTVGEAFPIHAGAASKILLAAMSPAQRAAALQHPLPGYSTNTITDRDMLQAQLARAEELGWAEDRGEHTASVCAIATPVRASGGKIVAAVSLAYLAERHEPMKQTHLADLKACAEAIARELARYADPPA